MGPIGTRTLITAVSAPVRPPARPSTLTLTNPAAAHPGCPMHPLRGSFGLFPRVDVGAPPYRSLIEAHGSAVPRRKMSPALLG